MPTARFDGDDSERIGSGLTGTKLSTDVARVSNNFLLSEHIGKFVAGEPPVSG